MLLASFVNYVSMSRNVQIPQFGASSDPEQEANDFDFDDLFADTFTNEGAGPNNSNFVKGFGFPTLSAAETHQRAITAASNGNTPATVVLPTGGIKTPFHASAATNRQGNNHDGPIAKRARIESSGVQAERNNNTSLNGPLAGGSGAAINLPVGVGIKLGLVGGRGGFHAPNGSSVVNEPVDYSLAEKRERNREHAKNSRVRRKFMLESLQEQVSALQRENQQLRSMVQEAIPEHAQQIISSCCETNALFGGNESGGTGNRKNKQKLVRSDFQLISSLNSGQRNFVLSDPRLPDNPIVFATPGFYEMTGYKQEQVLGKNCRFLQGPGTDPATVTILRKAIEAGADCTVCILNYKADGTPFWNQVFVASLRDADNCIVNYVGVQREIQPDFGANTLEDRVDAAHPLQGLEEDGAKGTSTT